MVTNLMSEVTEQGTVWLAPLDPAPFSFDLVRLGEGYRDDAVLMTRHDPRRRSVGEEIEDEAVLRVLGARVQRQPPAQQRVEQAMFGGLQIAPAGQIARDRQIGNIPIVSESQAEAAILALRQQPVAGVLSRIETKKSPSAGVDGPEAAPLAFQRDQDFACRIVTQLVAATTTRSIFEIQNVSANLAGENLHGASLHLRGTGRAITVPGWLHDQIDAAAK